MKTGSLTKLRQEFELYYERKFNKKREFWATHYPEHLSLYAEMLYSRRLQRAAKYISGDTGLVLDDGCGIGDFVNMVIAEKNVSAIGLDISYSNLKKARENVPNRRADFIQSMAEQLPLRPSCFSFVVSLDVLEHTLSPLRSIKEIYTILVPGGTLICVTPNGKVVRALYVFDFFGMLLVRLVRAVLRKNDKVILSSSCPREQFFSRSEMLNLLRTAGFIVEEFSSVGFWPAPDAPGAFGYFLRLIYHSDRLSRGLVPIIRKLFLSAEKLEILNQKLFVVARKPR